MRQRHSDMTHRVMAMGPMRRMRSEMTFMWDSFVQLSVLSIYFGVIWRFIPGATLTPSPRQSPRLPSSVFQYARLVPGGIHLFSEVMLAAGVALALALLAKRRAALGVIVATTFVMFVAYLTLLDGAVAQSVASGGSGLTVSGFFLMITVRCFHAFQAVVRRWTQLTVKDS